MRLPPLTDTERVAFSPRVGDTNSYENESDNALPCVGTVGGTMSSPTDRQAPKKHRHQYRITLLAFKQTIQDCFFVSRMAIRSEFIVYQGLWH